jgi:hypothetical protein
LRREFHAARRGDLLLQPNRPIAGVDHHSPEAFVPEIHDVTHRGGEDAVGLARSAGVGFGPRHRHRFLDGSGGEAGSILINTWPMTSGWLSPESALIS